MSDLGITITTWRLEKLTACSDSETIYTQYLDLVPCEKECVSETISCE